MIYVLYCDQSKMVKDALKRNVTQNFGEINDFNYSTVDMKDTTLNSLAELCSYLPLGCDKKAVVVEDFYLLEKVKYKLEKDDNETAFLNYVKEQGDETFLYLLVYSNKLPKTNKIYKALANAGCTFQKINQLDEKEWNVYIPRFFKKRGVDIDLDASAEFVRRIDGDYAKFLTDSEKLLTYCIDSKHITLEDINVLVSAPLEEKAYLISSALVKGDNAEALRIYNDLKKMNSQEVLILRTLETQFRFLNMVEHCYFDEQETAVSTAKILNANPWRVKANVRELNKMRRGKALDSLEELYQIEKGIMTGKLDSALGLTLFLAKFDPKA